MSKSIKRLKASNHKKENGQNTKQYAKSHNKTDFNILFNTMDEEKVMINNTQELVNHLIAVKEKLDMLKPDSFNLNSDEQDSLQDENVDLGIKICQSQIFEEITKRQVSKNYAFIQPRPFVQDIDNKCRFLQNNGSEILDLASKMIKDQILCKTSDEDFVFEKTNIAQTYLHFKFMNSNRPFEREMSFKELNMILDSDYLDFKYILEKKGEVKVNLLIRLYFLYGEEYKEKILSSDRLLRELAEIEDKINKRSVFYFRLFLDQIYSFGLNHNYEPSILEFFKSQIRLWLKHFKDFLSYYSENFFAILDLSTEKLELLEELIIDESSFEELINKVFGLYFFSLAELREGLCDYYFPINNQSSKNLLKDLLEDPSSFLTSKRCLKANWNLLNSLERFYKTIFENLQDYEEDNAIGKKKIKIESFEILTAGMIINVIERPDPKQMIYYNFDKLKTQIEKLISKTKRKYDEIIEKQNDLDDDTEFFDVDNIYVDEEEDDSKSTNEELNKIKEIIGQKKQEIVHKIFSENFEKVNIFVTSMENGKKEDSQKNTSQQMLDEMKEFKINIKESTKELNYSSLNLILTKPCLFQIKSAGFYIFSDQAGDLKLIEDKITNDKQFSDNIQNFFSHFKVPKEFN